ncbi:hypothetical protein TNCV_673351 [Trichonephila clavipes]|uniref:Uncharacterized protein n=1 Tax=Trichonephila clavipes TaxID=2585209 RepID=A0A8X7BIK6_TRICX|nr:hypothetical protein TNCV_673351 [Trichonephila clavipes]
MVRRYYCYGLVVLSHYFNGIIFKAISVVKYLTIRNASFNHDGSSATLKGAVGLADAVVREVENMAGLKMSSLKISNIWIPVGYEASEIFYFITSFYLTCNAKCSGGCLQLNLEYDVCNRLS